MTLLNGLLLNADDTELWDVELRQEDGSTLSSLYHYLNCRTVDVIRLTDSIDLWVDDEAMLIAEPEVNHVLTNITIAFGHYFQPIHGAGVFLSGNDETGTTESLTPEQVSIIRNAHKQALLM